ncbi:PREDICTED: uncharacterized protein LOC108565453 isoform X2 [Nicrophorus vespilloides]|uniref:Uncharacterized protein LOC108565453 isoform X2 n=1 Tax=Nicrophorus vespilloides TaxID=110193 RepID=A0ABM1N0R6_NICVS|nr:PREDICTED: uncharacterized protein LOC108565453 isoform X2 [Nicrophorus vespilloides]
MYGEISKHCESFPTTDMIHEMVNECFNDVEDVDDESESDDDSSCSETTMSSFTKNNLKIVPNFNIQEHIKALKTHNPLNNLFNSHSDEYFETLEISDEEQVDNNLDRDFSSTSFYKPDTITPPRFRSSYQGFVGFIDTCQCKYPKSWVDDSSCSGEYWDSFRLDPLDYKTPSSVNLEQSKLEVVPLAVHDKSESKMIIDYLTHKASIKTELELNSEDLGEHESDIQVLKEWAYFKLMEQRGMDMDNPGVGWVPWTSFLKEHEEEVAEETESIRSYSTAGTEQDPEDDSIELMFKMMKAIIDFVFEYFYENFHFTLIKLAFRSTPNLITQKLNEKWHTPKIIKQDFKRPKASPVKKEKKAKGKKEKRKKSKSPKRKKKDKKSKKGKKAKKEKPKKMTKEELARKRQEEALLEAERRRILENKVYMFPLADAASEDLFMAIFENWVAGGDKKKKGKKGKKGKKKK